MCVSAVFEQKTSHAVRRGRRAGIFGSRAIRPGLAADQDYRYCHEFTPRYSALGQLVLIRSRMTRQQTFE